MKQVSSFSALVFMLFLFFFNTSCSNDDLSESDSMVASISNNTIYTVDDITNFIWITGNSSWMEASKNRLWSSQFSFKTNGVFIYEFDYDSSLSYKLTGEYFETSTGYSFIADYSVFNGGGSQQIVISGNLQPLSGGQFELDMEYGSSAYYGAVVNDQEFFNQASKRFTTAMIIE